MFPKHSVLQFDVQAYDQADPDRKARATVTINVVRNQNGPVCTNSITRFSISEYDTVPAIVGSVTAPDQDNVSHCHYFLLCPLCVSAIVYFELT